MFLENKAFVENAFVDERISRAINNDHTAAMKISGSSKKLKKKGSQYSSDMIYVCMLCQKAFKNPLVHRKHMKLHSDRAHHCHLCGKKFLKKHHLQVHLQSHAKHHLQCPLCSKSFSQKGHLNNHLKLHAQARKTYKCSICDKVFAHDDDLQEHIRLHNTERPFECEVCHKSFNIKSSLQRHMNCHTGEKPFICDICNRGYTRRSVLMLHIQQVHENKKPFQCDECHLCFSQKGNLQAHFRRKHLHSKSDLRREKGKDRKRGIKRSHVRQKAAKMVGSKGFSNHYTEDPSRNKPAIDNTALHSYASKVKAIVSRGASRVQASKNQRTVNKLTKPVVSLENAKREEPVAALDSSPSADSFSSLSDEAIDPGCSSSSSEDIPEMNFPGILEPHVDGLNDFESLLGGNWDFMGETDILGSSSVMGGDAFSSPSKSNALLSKGTLFGDEILPTLSWTDEGITSSYLIGPDTEDKDFSNICGMNSILDGISSAPEKKSFSGQVSNRNGLLNFNVHKGQSTLFA